MTRPLPMLLIALALGAAAVAPPASAASRPDRGPAGKITVSAAASLTEAFTRLAAGFERQHPRADITLNFGPSSALVTQIRGGAPTDVFASADLEHMEKLVKSGDVTTAPVLFARNRMAIATKPGNPERVKHVDDLEDVGIVALCAPQVPCGSYATEVLARANVVIPESRVTRAADPKATLGAVATGDADAAIVYATDVTAAGRTVAGVRIPDEQNVVAEYPIAPVASTDHPRLAKAFVAYVRSAIGQKTLERFGFLAP